MTLSLIIISVPVFLATLVWLRWRTVTSFWEKRGVPHKPPHPVFGSLTFLYRQSPNVWMQQLYKEFKSPLIGIWLFWRPALVVNDPALARKILVKDSEVFPNRLISSGSYDPIGSLNLFTVNDPLWSFLRKRMTPIFTSAKLRALQHIYESKAKDLVQRIRTDLEKVTANLRNLFSDFTTDVIGEAAFGVACHATVTGHSALRSVTDEFMKFSVWRSIAWICIFFYPDLVDFFRFSLFPKTAVKSIRRIFNTIVTQRGGYEKETNENRDLLDMLLKTRREAALQNKEISKDVLIAQAAVMLQGGFDTTAVTLTYTVYELAFDPDRQDKLYQQLAEARDRRGGKDLDAATLKDVCYLNCVIKEILRLYPSMGWLDRVALEQYQVNDLLSIPAGTTVYINAVGMQRSADHFPEPDAFRPERFLPENEHNIAPYTYMPFGEGPRNCIGQRFAYNSLRQALAEMILNFEVRPLPNSRKPHEVGAAKESMFLSPDGPLSVEFVPRKY